MTKAKPINQKLMAEFIGILLGDGCIGIYRCKKGKGTHIQYRVKITLDSRNVGYVAFTAHLFSKVFGFRPLVRNRTGENTCDVLSYKKETVRFLLEEVGLKLSPKWDTAGIPKAFTTKECGAFVLRGYFDTDGSVIVFDNNGTKYPRIEMKVCPAPMQKQFAEILSRLEIRFRAHEIGKGKIVIQVNGRKEVQKWASIIGSDNPVHKQKLEAVCASDSNSSV